MPLSFWEAAMYYSMFGPFLCSSYIYLSNGCGGIYNVPSWFQLACNCATVVLQVCGWTGISCECQFTYFSDLPMLG